ncbi:MAG: BMP family ABC transporter substrate-binding protein [Acidimicrobiales bacterium]
MYLRLAGCFLALGLILTACGGGESATTDAAGTSVPAERQSIEGIAALAMVDESHSGQLDDFCRNVYGDAALNTEMTVGLVAHVASIDDGTFNQAAFEGMEAASRCFGVTTTFLDSASDDAAAQIASFADRDLDVIITVGFQFQDATLEAVEARPDLRFIGVDQANPDRVPNYVAISFDDGQVGFLAGATAALMTESGTVGIVAGPDSVPPVVAIADGFEAGVRQVSPDVTVLREHLDSFADAPAGARQASDFVKEGADVIFGAAGETGSGAILAGANAGARVIGVDQDEYFTTFAGGAEPNADRLVSSAMKRVDLGVFLTLAAMTTGEVEGGDLVLNATNGGVTYAPFHSADVPASVASTLERLRIDLAAGKLETVLPE